MLTTKELMFAKLGLTEPDKKDDTKEGEVLLFLSRPTVEPDKPKPQAIVELVQQLFKLIQEQDSKLQALQNATNAAYTHIRHLEARLQALQMQTMPLGGHQGGIVPGYSPSPTISPDTIWGYPITVSETVPTPHVGYPNPITVSDIDTTVGGLMRRINTALGVSTELIGRTSITTGTTTGSDTVTLTPSMSTGTMRVVSENGVMSLQLDDDEGSYTIGQDMG